MTRENKIALVVGFAIMLVIGVLLSDHLAQQVRGPAADLSAIDDPLKAPPGDQVEFLPLLARSPDPPHEAAEDPPIPTEPASPPMHVVQAGETLIAIARDRYGDPTLADPLARHNKLPAPDRLAQGLRLLVPPRSALLEAAPAPTVVPAVSSPTPTVKMATYTVQSGDTLSQLAQKLMGTARATDRLWNLNKATLSHPDAIAVGMELRYPASAAP